MRKVRSRKAFVTRTTSCNSGKLRAIVAWATARRSPLAGSGRSTPHSIKRLEQRACTPCALAALMNSGQSIVVKSAGWIGDQGELAFTRAGNRVGDNLPGSPDIAA